MKLNTKDFEEKMKKAISVYEENLATVRAGQASSAVIAKVNFEYWGAPTPITSMADIRVADAKTLTITPYDATTLKAMEKAILASDVGITPTNDGKCVRLVFPALTEERRKELTKKTSKMGEDCKVAIRNIRREANDAAKALKKNSEITEDDLKSAEKTIQDVTDKLIKEVDAVVAKKDKEIMEI
jgi:ribosome recycling factor